MYDVHRAFGLVKRLRPQSAAFRQEREPSGSLFPALFRLARLHNDPVCFPVYILPAELKHFAGAA